MPDSPNNISAERADGSWPDEEEDDQPQFVRHSDDLEYELWYDPKTDREYWI